MVHILYRLVRYILYTFLPLWILVSSLAFHIPNADIQKDYFEDRNVYENFTTEVNNIESLGEFSFERLIQFSLLQNLISPSFTQEVVEQNIDITTEWLRGETDIWTLYIPSQQVSDTLQSELDESILEFEELANIPVCDATQEENIRLNGFSQDTNCLPQSVINGQSAISDVVDSQSFENNFLKSLEPDSTLNTSTDRIITETSGISTRVSSIIIQIRDFFVFIQRSLTAGWVLAISIIVSVYCLGILAGKSTAELIRSMSFRIGVGSLGLFVSYMLTTGISLFLTSGASSFLFPAIPGSNVIAFINTEALWWLVSQANWLLWAGGIAGIIWVVSFFIPKLPSFNFSRGNTPRHPKTVMQDSPLQYEPKPSTFDETFLNEIEHQEQSIASDYQQLDTVTQNQAPVINDYGVASVEEEPETIASDIDKDDFYRVPKKIEDTTFNERVDEIGEAPEVKEDQPTIVSNKPPSVHVATPAVSIGNTIEGGDTTVDATPPKRIQF